MRIIVSDSSPLIILGKLNRMDLLRNIFEEVFITQVVFEEISAKNDVAKKILTKTDFIKLVNQQDTIVYNQLQQILDKGEASAIAFAKEQNLPLMIDEKKGRKIAKQMDIEIIGFLGVLLLNFQKQHISKNDAIEILNEAERFNYRIRNSLKQKVLYKML